eukprot:TRINITY_DN37329_c0_g1_i1.p1 TRINITY_DN37329_c0_g1~~TRINITY_DN37329_c0_g1_i1.p1  ORF type:complete len:237 (-),score=45.62 TRINITY_DN37329_c0_g1_i1:128-838(-)
MDPITLHFNIFRAGGSGPEARQTFQVDDPTKITVSALKRRLFPDAMEGQKSVRFIASGHILQDTASLAKCGLGRESHIHVSISDRVDPTPPTSPVSTPALEPAASCPSIVQEEEVDNSEKTQEMWDALGRFAMILALAGLGFAFHVAYRRRRTLSHSTSQTICIAAAVWIYALLCHGLPALFKLIGMALSGRESSSGKFNSASESSTAQVTTMLPQADELTARARNVAATSVSITS